MNRTIRLAAGIGAIIVGVLAFSALFTVHQAEQALVLQFGKVVRQVQEPGLNFKIPFVQNVIYFDKRVLDYNNPAGEIPTLDQKQVIVDAFARYRIVNPLLFFQTVANEAGMRQRLSNIIDTNLRNILGGVPLVTILTEQRAELMKTVAQQVDQQGQRFGINVLDVRIMRVDLPEENSQAIFRRMQTQREQEARKIRAEGDREDKRIRAEADKQSRIIVADAQRQAEILRGEGDGKAQEIYNKAFGQDPQFFRFYESMKSYREGLRGDSTRYIGPPDGDFFRFFGDSLGGVSGD
ncbi:MAG: protease modulator HflC [Alphaproteobacteria bacterium]|nr:protease modulator HflC [Alphaproteobacteria bacterium]